MVSQESIAALMSGHKELQSKFNNYLISFSASGIAFSIHIIYSQPDTGYFTILYLAMVNWIVAIYKGMKMSEIHVKVSALNISQLQLEMVTNEQKRNIELMNLTYKRLNKYNKKAQDCYEYLKFALLIGICLFIFWVIITQLTNNFC